jgi:hypothetical protein
MEGFTLKEPVAWETRSLPRDEKGRSYITAEMLMNQPHLGEMIRRSPGEWDRNFNLDVWKLRAPGEVPVRIALYGEVCV